MTDRKKLEAAVAECRRFANTYSVDAAYSTILTAAEAYLASLPKPEPMWKVRVWGYGEDSAQPYAEYERRSAHEAARKASHEITVGARKVEIEAPWSAEE